MADYLCRVRIDRAALDENLLLVGEGSIETARFYLKLSSEVKEGYITVDEFNTFLYENNNLDSIKVQALLDILKATNKLAEDGGEEEKEIVDATNGYPCPLCLAAGREPIYVNESNIESHIKICGKCGGYYCDGGQEIIDVTEDGKVIYPETHKRHFTEAEEKLGEGHYPEEKAGIKIPDVIPVEEIFDKSLLRKFCMYCLCLDEKENYREETGYHSSLNSYLKSYPTDTTYLSYKYTVKLGKEDEKVEYVLRLKVEVSPCEYFLTREYHSLEGLNRSVSEFLSHSVLPEKKEPEQPTPEPVVVNEEMTIPSARIEGDEFFDDNLDLEF